MKCKMAVCATLVLLTLSGCHRSASSTAEPVCYTVTTPCRMDVSVNKDYVAQIKSVRNIEIRSQVQGCLQQVFVDEGHYVKAGQPLFSIDARRFQAEANKAKADLTAARIDYGNTALLAKNAVVAPSRKALAKVKVESAAADYRLARLRLQYAVVRAPFSGYVGSLPKKAGSWVDEGELLTTLSDNSAVYAYYNLSEPEYLEAMARHDNNGTTPAQLILANGQAYPSAGVVQGVAGEFDAQTGSIPFKARFNNAAALLRNGQTGKVRLHRVLPHAMVIPQQSTYDIQDKKYVFVVDGQGIVHARAVTVAYELPQRFVLSGGLGASDRFLVEGVQKVKEGDHIRTRFKSSVAVLRQLHLSAG